MKIFGLTGGIGSGKTTVARIFESLGVPWLDADEVARKLREPGNAAHTPLLHRFGTTDRFELRAILSKDPQAKKELEAILHPLIKTESDRALNNLAMSHPRAPFLIYEASLLIEAGRSSDFSGLILVISPEKDRIQRIIQRDHINSEAAEAMLRTQMTDQDRLPYAQYVIKNEGSLEDLHAQAQKILDQIKAA